MCPARGFICPISFVQFPLCSRSAGERGIHRSFHRKKHLRGGFCHQVSTNRQHRYVCKILPSNTLPAAGDMISSHLQCLHPNISPLTQSFHRGTKTLVAHKSVRIQPVLHLSSEPILPQQVSSWQSATISPSQFSDGALPWFPPSASHFSFQTP